MNITLIEPFFSGSHKAWATELAQHCDHDIHILKLSGHYWKWRMHGGAVTLARQYRQLDFKPGLILATDMLDLTTFLSLTRELTHDIPTAIYFHENQLNYPWSERDRDVKKKRNNHYSFINYASALAADKVYFNSNYHKEAFLAALRPFLKGFPDKHELNTIETIRKKSAVLPLGLNLEKFDRYREERKNEVPLLLWNHRWEYDKNPGDFFEALYRLDEEGLDFRLVVLGENYSHRPTIFDEAQLKLQDKIVHWGYVDSFEEYARWLWRADIIPVTSIQDFFGISVIEAVYCGCTPILPERLAYPEHFPVSDFPELYYKDMEGLVSLLRRAVQGQLKINIHELKKAIKQYEWSYMSKHYDELLQAVKR